MKARAVARRMLAVEDGRGTLAVGTEVVGEGWWPALLGPLPCRVCGEPTVLLHQSADLLRLDALHPGCEARA